MVKQSIVINQTFSQDITRRLIKLGKKKGMGVQEIVRNYVSMCIREDEIKNGL